VTHLAGALRFLTTRARPEPRNKIAGCEFNRAARHERSWSEVASRFLCPARRLITRADHFLESSIKAPF
jgi:hypothetical protein